MATPNYNQPHRISLDFNTVEEATFQPDSGGLHGAL